MVHIYIKQVTIENFMGIKLTSLTLPKNGVIEVIGKNKDSKLMTSNGAGKTTVFLAILQGLFNKIPAMDLDSINNLDTKRPYTITLDIEVGGDTYHIINNRNDLTITIHKNQEVVSTRIRESLSYIEHEILGVSYNEFLLLTRITTGSIKSLFEVTSSNLLMKLFNLHELDVYETRLRKQRALLNSNLRKVSANINKATTPLFNKEELEAENKTATRKVTTLLHNSEQNSIACDTVSSELSTLRDRLGKMKGENCQTCGQPLPLPIDTSVSAEDLQAQIDEKSKLVTTYTRLVKECNTLATELTLKTQRNETRLLIAQEFVEHNLTGLKEEQQEIKLHLTYIDNALSVINKGEVHLHFLSQFLKTLNTLLTTSLSPHSVTAYLDKTSIYYRVKTDGMEKNIKQLSGGEATIIGLSILSAIFTTISTLVSKNINLLILDEAIHATDSISEEIIANIIKNVNNKTIYVIQHHNEIPQNVFTDKLLIEKVNKEVRVVDEF